MIFMDEYPYSEYKIFYDFKYEEENLLSTDENIFLKRLQRNWLMIF